MFFFYDVVARPLGDLHWWEEYSLSAVPGFVCLFVLLLRNYRFGFPVTYEKYFMDYIMSASGCMAYQTYILP